MAKQTRQVGSFIATDDNGRRYRLIVYQDSIQTQRLDGSASERPGLKSVFTEDGQHVNCLSQGEYEVVESRLRLHSSDPGAI
jgi:hypothetical protein